MLLDWYLRLEMTQRAYMMQNIPARFTKIFSGNRQSRPLTKAILGVQLYKKPGKWTFDLKTLTNSYSRI